MIDFACKRLDIDEIIRCAFGFTKAEFKIFKSLMRERDFLGTKEISKKTGFDVTTVQKATKKMHEKNLLERRQKNISGGGYLFSYKVKNKIEIRSNIKEIIRSWTKKVEEGVDRW